MLVAQLRVVVLAAAFLVVFLPAAGWAQGGQPSDRFAEEKFREAAKQRFLKKIAADIDGANAAIKVCNLTEYYKLEKAYARDVKQYELVLGFNPPQFPKYPENCVQEAKPQLPSGGGGRIRYSYATTAVGVSFGINSLNTDYIGTGFNTSGTLPTACVDGYWDVSLRYAGEFAGFRVASGAGKGPPAGPFVGLQGSACQAFGGVSQINISNGKPHETKLGTYFLLGANVGAVVPIPTGFFAQGNFISMRAGGGFAEGQVQINVPATTGANDWRPGYWIGAEIATGGVPSFWGTGISQTIDTRALELYLAWRHLGLETKPALLPAAIDTKVNTDIVMSGARIRF